MQPSIVVFSPGQIVPAVVFSMNLIFILTHKVLHTDARFLSSSSLGLGSIWEKYYEEAHAVICAIDVACPSWFEDANIPEFVWRKKKRLCVKPAEQNGATEREITRTAEIE
ncbi:hypothetical protein K1719_016345 [Acacia pycnantha]|nr:hypothetical protein K1719_016345 [Acacia pycnantha]